ncbi:MAG: chromosomal replication initiator protein DnaA [Chloroherpetonaceae bacterium]|nr:chromosomal replication initiator protein DnaA [Chloroherpetonaceae bacterium]
MAEKPTSSLMKIGLEISSSAPLPSGSESPSLSSKSASAKSDRQKKDPLQISLEIPPAESSQTHESIEDQKSNETTPKTPSLVNATGSTQKEINQPYQPLHLKPSAEQIADPLASSRTASEVWNQCLDFLRDNLNPQAFSTWFEPITAVSLVGEELTVQVKSHFIYEFIEENYYNILRSSLIKFVGPGAKMLYSVEVVKTQDQMPSVTLTLPQQHIEQQSELTPYRISQNRKISELFRANVERFQSYLNPKYSFDNYIKGDCNVLAYAAAKSVAENPGNNSYNPLFIYGGVGLGKTHLIQSIGNYARAKQKAEFVLYVSSEKFTIDFVSAIQNDRIREFAEFYRSIDLLIIDDIQFFAGKEKTQEEIFHIFNALFQSNKQIVLSSDRPLKDIRDIEERLLSRFASGLSADLQLPDYETRLAILNRKSEEHGITLARDVSQFICTNVNSNIREMEGCLIKLLATASISGQEIDLALAKNALRDIIREKSKTVTLEMIEKVVADYFGLSANDLKGKSRKQEIAEARQVAMFLSKNQTGKTLKTIGLHFGGRDHTTVMHAVSTIESKLNSSFETRQTVDELRRRLDIISL